MAGEDKEILIQIKVDNEQAQKSITEQSRKIELLKKNTDKLKKTNKELATQGSATAKERAKNSEQIAKNSLKISEANKVRKRAIQSQKAESGSLTDLRNKLATLTDSRNKDLTVGSQAFNKANADIHELTTTIKEAEQGGDDFRRSVGKYPNTFKDAAGAMAGFGNSTEGATGSVDALGKVIRLNPIGILISLLIAMVAAFAQTEEGAKKLKIIMSVLSSLFKDFISLLADGGKVIVDFFENPLESIKAFGDALTNFVQRRVEELLKGLGQLGSAISKLFSGDFTGALEDAKKGAVNLTTSLIPVAGIVKDLAPAVEEYTDKLVENAEETVKLTTANYNLQRSLLATEKQIVKLQGQEAVLAKRSEDATLSFQEQEKAQEELILVQQKRFDLQQTLLSKQIGVIQSELKLAKSRNEQTLEIEQRLTEKQKELITNRNEQKLEEANNIQITSQRNQDIWEQELDFIIDVGEKRRTRFEEIATDEANSLAIRTEGLNAYDANLEQFLKSQRASFVEEGLTEEEFDKLLGIQDPAKLAEAITAQQTLSEVEKNRLREVFIEFENAEVEKANVHKQFQDITTKNEQQATNKRINLAKKEAAEKQALQKQVATSQVNLLNSGFELAKAIAGEDEKLQKALAISKIIFNTAIGISRAFADLPPPASFIQAGAVAITGAAQLINVSRGSKGGGATSSPSPSSSGNLTSEPIADTSSADKAATQQEALENAIAGLGLTVSVTEINDAQSNVEVSEEGSQI
jgi:hypothetical protein